MLQLPEIGHLYFTKTGLYFDYEEASINHPENHVDEEQKWFRWVETNTNTNSRDFEDIEDDCSMLGEKKKLYHAAKYCQSIRSLFLTYVWKDTYEFKKKKGIIRMTVAVVSFSVLVLDEIERWEFIIIYFYHEKVDGVRKKCSLVPVRPNLWISALTSCFKIMKLLITDISYDDMIYDTDDYSDGEPSDMVSGRSFGSSNSNRAVNSKADKQRSRMKQFVTKSKLSNISNII